jgi:hypothetical protein
MTYTALLHRTPSAGVLRRDAIVLLAMIAGLLAVRLLRVMADDGAHHSYHDLFVAVAYGAVMLYAPVLICAPLLLQLIAAVRSLGTTAAEVKDEEAVESGGANEAAEDGGLLTASTECVGSKLYTDRRSAYVVLPAQQEDMSRVLEVPNEESAAEIIAGSWAGRPAMGAFRFAVRMGAGSYRGIYAPAVAFAGARSSERARVVFRSARTGGYRDSRRSGLLALAAHRRSSVRAPRGGRVGHPVDGPRAVALHVDR